MRGQSPGTFFTQDALASFKGRYFSLMTSLHSLALEMEAKKFPANGCREWTHRSTAISAAVKTLIDGKSPPPLTGKYKKRGLVTADDYASIDEELL